MLLALVASTLAVGVGMDEFSLASYRASVPAGSTLRLNATNRGEDPHDLALRAPGGRVLGQTAKLPAGSRGTLRVRVTKPGRYTLFCTLPGHERAGMHATLVVTRSRTLR